jgi:T5SS/PEP-CTERM-associated repeat protein
LVVQTNATLSAGPTVIGFLFSSSGNVSVTGPGSIFTVNGDTQVGAFGTGTLNVENGGTVSIDGFLQLGLLPGGDGTVTVSGASSSLVVSSGDIVVGGSGTGRLTIANGGAVAGGDPSRSDLTPAAMERSWSPGRVQH